MDALTTAGLDPGQLVGRAHELEGLLTALETSQVVTIVGPGGVGKSSLAQAAAEGGRGRWPDGVIACDLSDVRDVDAVRPTVAGVAGVVLSEDGALSASLAGRRALVLLDNCEHLVEAVAAVVRELLAAGGGVRVLVTSRESLGFPGEQVFPLGPLAISDGSLAEIARSPAVTLFCDRAANARPDFALDLSNASALVALCRRLDGLPLALELAAARVRTLTPHEILERLERGMPLTAPRKTWTVDRHRSLAGVIDWSYDLLDESSRLVYERLGVAAGGVLLEAAEVFCAGGEVHPADVAALLDGLVDRSLVTVVERHGRTRYTMLDTLRAHAVQRLDDRGERAATRDRHADHFAEVSDRIRSAFDRTVPPSWVAWHGDDLHNVRAALQWCAEWDADADRAFRVASALWRLCLEGHARSVSDLVEEALGRWPATDHPLGPDVAGVGAIAYLVMDEPEDARRLAEVACAAAGAPGARPATYGLRVLAELAVWHEDEPQRGLELLDEAAGAAASTGQAAVAMDVEHLRLMALAQNGDLVRAQRLAADLYQRASGANPFEALYARLVQCLITAESDVARASEMLDATLAEEDVDATALGATLAALAVGAVRTAQGRHQEAAVAFAQALDDSIRTGTRRFWVSKVASVLPLLVATGRPSARTLCAAAQAGDSAPIRIETLGLRDAVKRLGLVEPAPMTPRAALELAKAEMVALAQEANRAPANVGNRTEPAPTPTPPAGNGHEADAPPSLQRAGAVWTVRWAGRETHLRDMKGVRDLALLLREPGRERHVLDLAAPVGATADAGEAGDLQVGPGSLGDVIDEQARSAYRRRVVALQAELRDAEETGQLARADAAQVELDALVSALAAAYGLGGRARRISDTAERARSAVGWRIRSAVRHIGERDSDLAVHLRESLRLGIFCSYDPQPPVTWQVHLG